MISASRSASSAASGSWSRTLSRQPARGRGRRQRVGAAGVAGERLARLLGGGAQGVGEAEPGLVGGQGVVLARLRGDCLDLAEPEAQQVGLAGPLAGRGDHLVELARVASSAAVEVGVGRRGGRRAALPPNRSSASRWARGSRSRCWSDWPCTATRGYGDLGQGGHRHRRAADEGPRAALGRDVAGQHHGAVLDLAAGLLDRVGERGQVADARRRPRPAPAWPRCGRRRCRRGRPGAGRAR